jgi:hypothetical protein
MPKFVPTIATNKSMNRGFKLNKPTTRKQIEEDSNDLLTMPMDEQKPL